uniref:Similar to PIE1 (PHOTOPERIOD-INDEPENDENT EARLY FLOWERING 1) n=1 Tax=Arundo donax TaxID=35708 RepID=A0A0A9CXK2_ARUDO
MIVFPKPISSARIPLSLFSYIATNQSNPICWYSRRECLRRNGNFVRTFVVKKVLPVGCADLAAAAASAITSSFLSPLTVLTSVTLFSSTKTCRQGSDTVSDSRALALTLCSGSSTSVDW